MNSFFKFLSTSFRFLKSDTTTFIIKKFLSIILALLGLSFLIFVLARVLPGDPARMAVGASAPDWVIEEMRKRLRLDRPLHEQYIAWMADLLKGDLGFSVYTKRSVTYDILQYLPATLELLIFTEIFSVLGGIFLGVIAGSHAYKWPDNVVRVLAYIAISMPAFAWAIILQLLFVRIIPLFPALGRISVEPPPRITGLIILDSLIVGRLDVIPNALWHMTLPALSLSFGSMMQNARILRSGMVDVKGKQYMLLAEALGLPFRVKRLKFQLKPAVAPAITAMALSFGADMGNAFLVETVYNWPGLMRYGVTAMLNKDLNAIVAVTLSVGLVYAIANFAADIIIYLLDPRIRHTAR
ncbi:MAG: ABC transporter permease [Thermoprotei archaeon]